MKEPLSPKRRFLELARMAEAQGWTGAEFARKLKVTPAHISGLLNGPAEPSESLVELLQLVLEKYHPELFPHLARNKANAEKRFEQLMSAMHELLETYETNSTQSAEQEANHYILNEAQGFQNESAPPHSQGGGRKRASSRRSRKPAPNEVHPPKD